MLEPADDLSIESLVRAAIRQVWADCPDLVLDAVHERTVVAHIAAVLNRRLAELPGSFRADVEYDRVSRLGFAVLRKQLWLIREGRDELHPVVPDLIVHAPRGQFTRRNVLVLEAKKGRVSSRARELDYIKLGSFIEQLGYQHAVFLEFDGVGGRPRIEWIRSSQDYPDPAERASEEL
ncbi:hypothetical protein ACFVAV_02765 [Nocardia sp. NPDC057663]|uniref:hypothetical protein n=1 Tax=Nocardia sp. NPDC057663 TaxID=3346201 RepID=UPI00366CB0F4